MRKRVPHPHQSNRWLVFPKLVFVPRKVMFIHFVSARPLVFAPLKFGQALPGDIPQGLPRLRRAGGGPGAPRLPAAQARGEPPAQGRGGGQIVLGGLESSSRRGEAGCAGWER